MSRAISLPKRIWSTYLSHNRIKQIALFLVWTAAFSVSFTQWPLFSENQNTKFLIGMAAADYGVLADDWLANTADPLPLFSFLVYLVTKFLHPNIFYLIHASLLGLYLYSLFGIADHLFETGKTAAGKILFGAFVIAFHSSLLPPFSNGLFGTSLGWIVQSGVANQYLLNPVLQPSTFGVLLFFSVYLYLSGRFYWAATVAAVAAAFHSTYLPSAAILTLAYILIRWRNNRSIIGSPIGIGVAALLMVLPILAYNYTLLGPTSPEAWALAQDTIVNFRIPHHSVPNIWIDNTSYAKLGIALIALILIVRNRLFWVMLLALGTAISLTIAQMWLDYDTLAFIAPWRISVFLVPLSTAIIGAFVISLLFNHLPENRFAVVSGLKNVAIVLAIIWLGLMSVTGARAMQQSHEARRNSEFSQLWHYGMASRAPDQTYLVPTYMADFRLATGVPVVVTFKSHPYLDIEVIEWRDRLDAVNNFYNRVSCDGISTMVERYGVTHVVLEMGQLVDDCPLVEIVHRDNRFEVAKIK